MIFVKYDIPEIEQINTDTGRKYRTPSGAEYPSITTVLGSQGKEYLDAWRAKVGKDVADSISRKAATRGTMIHEWCENHLLGKENKKPMMHRETWDMFMNIVPVLDMFEEVHALEKRLWSDRLKIAGTVDCIAKVHGKLSIIDFKTSGRYKSREEIDSYFLQTAFYALAFWERTGVLVEDLYIMMTTQDDGLLEYHEKVQDWLPRLADIRAGFVL